MSETSKSTVCHSLSSFLTSISDDVQKQIHDYKFAKFRRFEAITSALVYMVLKGDMQELQNLESEANGDCFMLLKSLAAKQISRASTSYIYVSEAQDSSLLYPRLHRHYQYHLWIYICSPKLCHI
jgi:hypothetical protein